MNTLHDNLLQQIKDGDLDMKPRWHFVARAVLYISGTVLTVLTAVYLLSFILFLLRESGVGFALLHGFQGVSIFLWSAPWLLVAVAVVFVGALYVLVSQFAFSYSRPLVYTLFGVIGLVVIAATVLGSTSFHGRVEQAARSYQVPGFAPLYQLVDERRSGVTLGVVDMITDDGLVVTDRDGQELMVIMTSMTRVPPDTTFAVGQSVVVLGTVQDDVITALGVRPASAGRTIQRKPRPADVREAMIGDVRSPVGRTLEARSSTTQR